MRRFCRIVATAAVCIFFGLQGIAYSASVTKSWNLSESQKRYASSFGKPQQFMLLFDRPAGKVQGKVRRIESWIYPARSKFAIFDNGFFAEEMHTGDINADPSLISRTPLQPQEFNAGLTEKEVVKRYGKPDSIETAKLGRHSFRILRYIYTVDSPGLLSVTFLDSRIAGVAAGFVIKPDDIDGLKRELERRRP